jgi:2-isopropylmalate synthase
MSKKTHDAGEGELIYDWNLVARAEADAPIVELDDETLRDGLQSPSVRHPSIEQKKHILHLMSDLGIPSADIGLPGAGPKVMEDVAALAKEIVDHKLGIEPNCAARTLASDIDPIVEASSRAGIAIEASLFIGSSPIREYVEEWTLDRMLELSESSIRYAIDHGLSVMFVTEDTTRARPDHLSKLYTMAIECGARRICLADTVGHATPHGTRQLVRFMKEVVDKTGEDVKIDWHGHRDRGFALENCFAAIEAGANRVHGTALGVGERCGNTPTEHLLINLKLMGLIDNDLSKLVEYCEFVSEVCDVPIPFNHPVIGTDCFRTSTGVHAAAVIKALNKGHQNLANRVYSAVPADWVGREQRIEIGPMSGASNVIYWLKSRGITPDETLVDRIFSAAKDHERLLTEKEIRDIITTVKH